MSSRPLGCLPFRSRLTFLSRAGKTGTEVFPAANNFYARWRLQSGAVPILSEEYDSPPERLLQAIWRHQRLLRTRLKTLEGITVRVLHPGFLNREGGPDFRGAVVQFGHAAPLTGDVEVDVRSAGWRAHAHDRNPAFRKVILHVVWDDDQPAAGVPATLRMHDVLDAPLSELGIWLNSKTTGAFPESLRGLCTNPLKEFSPARLADLLHAAARIRFQAKAAHLKARARQVGWEQALWEGLFRALGYKHNAWPMQCLADHRERWFSAADTVAALQTRLLGVANLLPTELSRRHGGGVYVRRLWDQWWREREEFSDCIVPRSLWRFSGQRPANHPQRRIALAAHWLASGNLPAQIERWSADNLPDKTCVASLFELLQVRHDAFWSWHWTLRSVPLKKPQPLLGMTRATDFAVNVVLPWLWSRATEGKNFKLRERIEHRFETWPAAEDNAVLRLARERLLNGAPRSTLRCAAEQQGLIQIVRDFCDRSNAICEQCKFPELAREWDGFWTAGEDI